MTRVFLDKFFQLRGRAAVGERAPGVEIGHKHLFVRTEYFDCLAHEVDSTHDDDVIVELLGNLSQGQRIAHKVGHILDVTHSVVVGQDDGVFFFFESDYFLSQVDTLRDRGDNAAVFDFHLFIFEKNFFEKEV